MSINNAVEIFAHELAHAGVGVEQEHNERWRKAFDDLFDEYNKIGDEMFSSKVNPPYEGKAYKKALEELGGNRGMTEKERLIEILENAEDCLDYETMADYLLDNGVIVPPCKVGDVVYVRNREGKPQKMKFDNVDLRCTCTREDYCGLGTRCMDKESNICQYRFKNDFSDFGKIVFLTREEAEKALKESEK